ncbi:MAG: sigma-70 family RNA polymerase sigma factor [Clostridia bacterium]|nr:sigma-70 family RNA polymerase sigma factor [Clostridia bacterium]
MNKENSLVIDLESYKFDYQYFLEKSDDLKVLKKKIENLFVQLNDMRIKKQDTKEINEKLQIIIKQQDVEQKKLLKLLSKKQKIEKRIEKLPQPYRNVFFLRYIRGNSFDEIAAKMNYSTKRIYQLHKEGLDIYINDNKPKKF